MSFMMGIIYDECSKKPIMLNVFMPIVVILNVVAPFLASLSSPVYCLHRLQSVRQSQRLDRMERLDEGRYSQLICPICKLQRKKPYSIGPKSKFYKPFITSLMKASNKPQSLSRISSLIYCLRGLLANIRQGRKGLTWTKTIWPICYKL
jgi:hypothetical protein